MVRWVGISPTVLKVPLLSIPSEDHPAKNVRTSTRVALIYREPTVASLRVTGVGLRNTTPLSLIVATAATVI